MGMCKGCGTVVSVVNMVDGLCDKCATPEFKEKSALKKERANDLNKNRLVILNSIMVTTETMVNLDIEQRIEVTSASCVYGLNIIKDFFSGIRDFVGGRVKSIENPLEEARKEVIDEIKEKAYYAGGNAVIALKIEHNYSGSMISVFATGTIVKIADK